MKYAASLLCLVLAGCDAVPADGTAEPVQKPPGAEQALFSSFPAAFFDRAALACRPPAETVRPDRDTVRCESVPQLEALAGILIQYDGDLENLPKFVISIAGVETSQGYLVTTDNYLRVPQRDGSVKQVRFPDPRLNRQMRDILIAEGGMPI